MSSENRPTSARSTLVVVGEAATARRHEPIDERLLAALPAAARVLELRAGSDALQRAYAGAHPGCDWHALRISADGRVDLDDADARGPFDLVVIADALPWLADPAAVLRALSRRVAADGRLVLGCVNHASVEALAALVDGDLGVAPGRAPLPGQPRLSAPAPLFRLLMDAGWMPALVGHEPVAAVAAPVDAGLQAVARAFGHAPGGSAERVHRMARLVVEARPSFAGTPELDAPALFDVLVPTTDERQLRLNVEASAGLEEVGARIVSCRGAATPADAIDLGRPHLAADWVLLCHQDVHFPAGFGRRLNAVLAAIPAERRATTLIGFVGMGAGPRGQGRVPAGFVVDRTDRADHPATDNAVSIDELAIVMARDTVHRIDRALGWHLWATDLCLAAICEHHVFPRIVRLPLFHNSRTGWQLPAAFHESASRLARKWAGFGPIHTLCGVIDAAPETLTA
jgi:SAM-dependent methyltransferase